MKERESEKEYRERQKEIGQSRGIRAHFASALIIIKGSQASTWTHGGIQQDKCNSFTLILSACVCACMCVCVCVRTGEASSQSISSQALSTKGLERHLRSSEGTGDAVNLLPLTQPPPKHPVECEIDPGALR